MKYLITPIRRVLAGTAFAASVLLTACGGGSTAADTTAQAPASAAHPAPGLAIDSASTDPAAAAVPSTRQRALYTVSDSDTITGLAANLLPYIEQSYAAYFPGQADTYTLGPYTYRCYAATANCVGYTANDLYAFGPVVGRSTGEPVWVSSMGSFCDANPAACGLKLHRTLDIGGLTRHFTVHLPWKARGGSNTPVVFMLHGTSGTGDEFYNHSGWREKADAEGFIAVFPTALRHCFYEDDNANGSFEHPAERRTPTKWAMPDLGRADRMPLCTAEQRAGLPADAAAAVDHPLADDIAFFRAMVADVVATYAADPKRVYVTGFSNGGQMSHTLAQQASDLIAAAAANAGHMREGFGTPAPRPMSMIFVVGSMDDRFTENLGSPLPMTDQCAAQVFANRMQGLLGTLSLAATPCSWQEAQLYGQRMSIHQYTGSTAVPAASNRLYSVVVEGLTHTYPNYMPDALWSFFSPQSLP
jgi:poly(3-hydroxybutyrate) depolymerase